MADFHVRNIEGMRQIRVDLQNETIRAARGALSNYSGSITFTPRLPALRDILRSLFAHESRVRPYYTGTGSVLLQPSLAGFHVFELQGDEKWILEPGEYWASEANVDLGLHRDPFFSSFWAGDGFFAWKTTVSGKGKVAINAPGPVEEVCVKDGELKVQGRLVLGRTSGLRFRSVRSARFPRNFISGQERLRLYEGSGKALVCWTPYWNEYLHSQMTEGERISRTLFE
ncbi:MULTISPECIES: AIM24 family protein [unclassified Meridianimarinicoccus]|uniref:AIM24 family protein n=1 Tax=unclassified Meridianimarinicoccus TaxID=2923344 RepID=UPI001869101F|nr:AIM24 family protein [Fluviibacterium sp. MJW13]